MSGRRRGKHSRRATTIVYPDEFVRALGAGRRLPTKSSVASTMGRMARRCVRARVFFLAFFALALGPRYLPTTRLTTMAAMPASTALAIGDDRMSVIGLDPDACC